MPVCSNCKNKKDKSKFRERGDAKNGLQYWCKDCENKANKERYKLNRRRKRQKTNKKEEWEIKEEAKARMLKHRYNLSMEKYKQMYEDQDKKCAICLENYSLGGYEGLYIDHNHETNTVRGLLCPSCNSLIGKFMEDEEVLKRAVEYLNRYN